MAWLKTLLTLMAVLMVVVALGLFHAWVEAFVFGAGISTLMLLSTPGRRAPKGGDNN